MMRNTLGLRVPAADTKGQLVDPIADGSYATGDTPMWTDIATSPEGVAKGATTRKIVPGWDGRDWPPPY